MTRLILFGAPGAGKGSVGDCLEKKRGYVRIATGDLIRAEVKARSPLGLQVQEILDRGGLVSDGIIIEMVKQHVQTLNTDGYILDGFPRTLAQAQALSALPCQREIAFYLEVNEDLVVKRLLSRLVCQQCGTIYNTLTRPPQMEGVCDLCRGTVSRRSDDNEATIRQRIAVYLEQTMPVIEYYKGHDRLCTVDGVGSPKEVAERILKVLE